MVHPHLAPSFALAFALTLANSLPGQDPGLLQVAPVNGTTVGAWATSTTRDVGSVAIQCQQNADEFTLFFVHTTVDEAVAGDVAAAGVLATYPYFVSLPWLGSDTSFANANLVVDNPGTTVVIPPYRIIAQVQAYLNPNTTHPTFGRPAPATAAVLPLNPWTGWPTIAANDERQPWWKAQWTTVNATTSAVNVASIGRAAATMQAHQYAQLMNVTPDTRSLERLEDLLDSSLGFRILVQGVHVKRPPTGNPHIRFTQHNTLRRRSLNQLNQWFEYYGAHRWVPALHNADMNVYLAPRGDELHVKFPNNVSGLVARIYVPVPNSSPLSFTLLNVDQLINPVVTSAGGGQLMLDPSIARFPFPSTAGNQVVFFVNGLGQAVVPEGNCYGGALISTFDPIL